MQRLYARFQETRRTPFPFSLVEGLKVRTALLLALDRHNISFLSVTSVYAGCSREFAKELGFTLSSTWLSGTARRAGGDRVSSGLAVVGFGTWNPTVCFGGVLVSPFTPPLLLGPITLARAYPRCREHRCSQRSAAALFQCNTLA